MRFIVKLILPFLSSLLFIQCQSDDIIVNPIDQVIVSITDTVYVSENITADVTWEPQNLYILTDLISVTDNATLTIQAGVYTKNNKEQWVE